MQQEVRLGRRRFLKSAAMTIAAAQFGTMTFAKQRSDCARLARATAWLNSPPLTDAELQGKVVLVEFWTYSCINWRRQLPYIRAWAEKYRAQGLVVVGVHSPEFSFERNIENVRWAVKDMRVDYPIAVDNDRAIWRGFNNEYWPALYFADAKGKVRHHQFGEGEYEKSEKIIQALLAETGVAGTRNGLVEVAPIGPEAQADWRHLQSGENYLGYGRTENFASSASRERSRVYSVPKHLGLNSWALGGDWTIGQEAVHLNQPNGRIAYRFHARDLHLVMGPTAVGAGARFLVLIDGQPPGTAHGVDVDEQGNGKVVGPRMYQLVRQPEPIADRQFEVQFLDAGVDAFSFTFG